MARKTYVTIWIPQEILRNIDEEAKRQERSRNWIINSLLMEKFGNKKGEILCMSRQ